MAEVFPPDWIATATVVESSGVVDEVASQLGVHTAVVLVPSWIRQSAGSQGPAHSKSSGRAPFEQLLPEIAPVSSESVLVVLLPAGALSSRVGPAISMRVGITEHWDIAAVVEVQPRLPEVHRTFELNAVVLRAKATGAVPIKMFRIPKEIPSDRVRSDFEHLLKQSSGRSEYGYVLRAILDAEAGVHFDRDHPALAARREELSEFGEVLKLGHFFEIRRGIYLIDALRTGLPASPEDPEAVRILAGRDVT
ncbi:hypothetical protein [Nocardia asiatica]|uniref:hypothetical protein n=1 Tax=Nocardia asiatica TaxID=209252 RepID=UPI003EDF6773